MTCPPSEFCQVDAIIVPSGRTGEDDWLGVRSASVLGQKFPPLKVTT